MAAIDEIIEDAMRRWRDAGDLKRLEGRPLDLSDQSPDWFANRMLKNEGFSHPAIEKGKDVDQLLREAEEIAEQLRKHHAAPRGCPMPGGTVAWYGPLRRRLLAGYREKLETYNRAVLGFNLTVPDVLHKRPARVEELVARLQEATRLEEATLPEKQHSGPPVP